MNELLNIRSATSTLNSKKSFQLVVVGLKLCQINDPVSGPGVNELVDVDVTIGVTVLLFDVADILLLLVEMLNSLKLLF